MSNVTREENEILTQTGPGTPMGQVFRSYWIPAMLSERLPERDGPPIPLKLLGEKLVAFRDSNGKVGILDEFCPHRRVSLLYGRNEESGLRCVYHGWKFDVNGQCLETPAEPNPNFAKTIRHKSYPTWEAGGIVWTYMGSDAAPPHPEFLFTKLPSYQAYAFHYQQGCNYLQGMEADLDVSHPSFLHRGFGPPLDERRAAMMADVSPKTWSREEPFGFQTMWRWNSAPGKSLFWVDPFIAPCHTITPSGRTKHRWVWHAWVPVDDENHWAYYVHYDHEAKPDPDERRRIEEAFGHDQIDPANEWRSRATPENLHLLDRDRQKRINYSGIAGIAAQDLAITHSMGPIVDRSLEKLGAQDTLIVRLRHHLLKLARNIQAGQMPTLRGGPAYADIDTRMVITPRETTYEEVYDHRDWKWGEAG